jgi:putative PIN family toxin of toxin-antitoxin system
VIRATLDTNVLASALIRPGSIPDQVVRRWRRGNYELIMSQAIMAELQRTLVHPYFVAELSPSRQRRLLLLLRARATWVPVPAEAPLVATHPEDDLILATAVQGHAHYLVTGDRQLQLLDAHASVAIVSPRAFLDLLDGD